MGDIYFTYVKRFSFEGEVTNMTIKLYRDSAYKNSADAIYSNVKTYEYHSEDRSISFTSHDGRYECVLILKEGDVLIIDTLAEV